MKDCRGGSSESCLAYNGGMKNENSNTGASNSARPSERCARRVMVGMSGGVDSSVAVALLQDSGFEVIGVTCVFIDNEQSRRAADDAREVASLLGVKHVVRECCELFSAAVIRPFIESYAFGMTPSPCVECNRSCKIPSLIAAADEFGCEYVATGHYARVTTCEGRFAVAVAADDAKDQSYMLSMLPQRQLARLLLPLGSIPGGKPEVRRIANQRGLPTASKSDSQDICFIEGSHVPFLEAAGIEARPGDIVGLDATVLGRHEGLHRYTVGQRKGIGIGGAPEPYFVVEKRPDRNELVVAFASEARMVGASVSGLNWHAAHPDGGLYDFRAGVECSVKLRYRQRAVACRAQLRSLDGCADRVLLELSEPQPLTSPGQFAVLYDGQTVLAAGVIDAIVRVGHDGASMHGERS